ncbi:hypothetical protein ACQ4PT_004081 [Festuca glaucescens]
MAPPFAAAAVSSSSALFSPSSSRPFIRRQLPLSSISVRPRKLLLEVHGLTASVKETGQQILKGVDITIREGEDHAIMGKNGSGKSTLTKISCRSLYELPSTY